MLGVCVALLLLFQYSYASLLPSSILHLIMTRFLLFVPVHQSQFITYPTPSESLLNSLLILYHRFEKNQQPPLIDYASLAFFFVISSLGWRCNSGLDYNSFSGRINSGLGYCCSDYAFNITSCWKKEINDWRSRACVGMYTGGKHAFKFICTNKERSTNHKPRDQVQWECPLSGRLKFNFDNKKDKGEICVFTRTDDGDPEGIATVAEKIRFEQLMLHLEVEVLQYGCHHQGRTRIEVESSFNVLIFVINMDRHILEVRVITSDCRLLLNRFDIVQVRHIGRETNGRENRLAHVAKLGLCNNSWAGETP